MQHGKNFKAGEYNIIDDDVVFGDNVMVGNFCHIKSDTIVGNNTMIMDYVKLMPGTVIGDDCKIDDYVTTSGYVKIGNRVRIKRCSMIGQAVEIEDDVWVGSCVKTTRIKYPKVISEMKEKEEWIKICKGAMVGSGAIILAGVIIGEGAIIGAGAIIAKDCESYGIYRSSRAELVGHRKINDDT
jgi:acetyltransferase-like isoleucine patch superfamily enzyme